jgi:hypothetical protein
MNTNCDKCQKKDVCKFVDRMKVYAESMADMFKYPEWDDLYLMLKTNNSFCKFFKSIEIKRE